MLIRMMRNDKRRTKIGDKYFKEELFLETLFGCGQRLQVLQTKVEIICFTGYVKTIDILTSDN
jgi:hypothetical protein